MFFCSSSIFEVVLKNDSCTFIQEMHVLPPSVCIWIVDTQTADVVEFKKKNRRWFSLFFKVVCFVVKIDAMIALQSPVFYTIFNIYWRDGAYTPSLHEYYSLSRLRFIVWTFILSDYSEYSKIFLLRKAKFGSKLFKRVHNSQRSFDAYTALPALFI